MKYRKRLTEAEVAICKRMFVEIWTYREIAEALTSSRRALDPSDPGVRTGTVAACLKRQGMKKFPGTTWASRRAL